MNSSSKQPQAYTAYRWMENAHIFLWLIKDTCWAMDFQPGGIFMILPTVGVAFYLLWQSRFVRTEFVHNVAVCCWIFANSVWMLGEFFDHDSRLYAAGCFATGLVVLLVYYLSYFKKDKADKEIVTVTVEE